MRTRPRRVSLVFASAATSLAIGVGTMAAAAPAVAVEHQTVVTNDFSVMYTNLGLTRTQAMGIQCFLNIVPWNSGLVEDGYLGPASWEAMQRFLNDARDENLDEDGVPGPLTIKALQRWLKGLQKYNGPIDGDAGPLTREAFARQGTYSYNGFC
ncbi:peptidoglycan-binding protein [Streptomyces sp. NPDC057621]|uniref:peptidoglycan-binding domain-containing protein n=1 Tax=unclassified Streptomyces TaxID=2593676 RepID=UPI0036A40E94